MNHEFNNRMAAQRSILRAVNAQPWASEPLCGLSSKAIDRWVAANRLDGNAPLVGLVKSASAQLFFLANKSQEQISEQYQLVRLELMSVRAAILDAVRDHNVG